MRKEEGRMGDSDAKMKIRDSRYELMRIAAMLMIMASHCVKFTLGSDYEFLYSEASFNYAVAFIVIMLGNVGTYLFILLTCKFSLGKVRFKASRVIKLLWQTVTTCILCLIIAYVFHLRPISIRLIVRELLTPFDSQYWFITAMLIFVLILPALQLVDSKLDDGKIKVLCLVLILARPVRALLFSSLAGDLGDFVACFFVVSYLKRRPENWFKKHDKMGLTLYAGLIALLLLARYLLPSRLLGVSMFGEEGGLFQTVIKRLRQRTVFQLFCAICLFYAMEALRIKPSKWINFAAKFTLGVYLWHYNYVFRDIVWTDVFNAEYVYTSTNLYLLLVLIGPVLVYAAFSAAEYLRSRVLDDWLYPKLSWMQKLEAFIDRHYDWKIIEAT